MTTNVTNIAKMVAADGAKKAGAKVEKDVRKALQPATKPVKDAVHKARKWVDKTTSKVPVLGALAALPADIIDDVAQNILIEKKRGKKIKWTKPELVDHLPMHSESKRKVIPSNSVPKVQTAATMAVEPNPGPKGKGKKSTKRGHKKMKMRAGRHRLGQKLKRHAFRVKSRSRVKFRNKKTGAISFGTKLKTTEFLYTATIAATATAGEEILSGGLLINPHSLNLPRLSTFAQFYELYKIVPHVRLERVSNGTVDCELFAWFDPDCTDTIPVGTIARFQAGENHGGTPGYVSGEGKKDKIWTPKKNGRVSPVKWYYCDQAGTDPADIRQANQYRFRLLVKRPPTLYGYSAGTAANAGVPMVINLRFSYEITFRNPTLDAPVVPAAVGRELVYLQAASGSSAMSTASPFGLSASTTPSQYTVSSTFNDPNRAYVFANDGTYDYLIRVNSPGRTLPKYVMIVGQFAASTLTGGVLVNADTNLTAVNALSSLTASSNSLFTLLYSVDDIKLSSSITYNNPACQIHGTSITYYGAFGVVSQGWMMKFSSWASCSSPSLCRLYITEFNEVNEGVSPALHGPATIEYEVYNKWKNTDIHTRLPFDQAVEKYKKTLVDKTDELAYWKSKAMEKKYTGEVKEDYDYESRVRRSMQAFGSLERKLQDAYEPHSDDDQELYESMRKKYPTPIGMKPIKILQDDEKSEKGAPRPKVGSQK